MQQKVFARRGGTSSSPITSSSKEFKISLRPGWNMISAPANVNIGVLLQYSGCRISVVPVSYNPLRKEYVNDSCEMKVPKDFETEIFFEYVLFPGWNMFSVPNLESYKNLSWNKIKYECAKKKKAQYGIGMAKNI